MTTRRNAVSAAADDTPDNTANDLPTQLDLPNAGGPADAAATAARPVPPVESAPPPATAETDDATAQDGAAIDDATAAKPTVRSQPISRPRRNTLAAPRRAPPRTAGEGGSRGGAAQPPDLGGGGGGGVVRAPAGRWRETPLAAATPRQMGGRYRGRRPPELRALVSRIRACRAFKSCVASAPRMKPASGVKTISARSRTSSSSGGAI